MIVDIRGTQTRNKGAQLMLEAIVERFGENVRLAAPPLNSDYSIRARLGLFQTLHVSRFPMVSANLGNVVPQQLRRAYGLVADKEISGVLDASGFAFGDPFGIAGMKSESVFFRNWARRNVPIVMLPQAFGPFDDPEKRKWARTALSNASKIFVRDHVSADHIAKLNLQTSVELCPDFTISLTPATLGRINPDPFVALVPNVMLIRSGASTSANYLEVMTAFGEQSKRLGLGVVVIVHESGDQQLATSLAERLQAPIFGHENPRVLKAALGQAELVVASRFHAAVGALSQEVPTITIGWSHKYRELLKDFDVEDWQAEVDVSSAGLIGDVIGDSVGVQNLMRRRAALISRIAEMWASTEAIVCAGPPAQEGRS